MMAIIREHMPSLFKRALVVLALLLPLLLTGCEIGDVELEFILDLVVDWAVEKNLLTADCPPPYDSDDCNFGINAAEIARWQAGRNATLGAGMDFFGVERVDPEVQVALDAGEVVYTMEKADALVEEGLAEGNLEKIDKAIKLRPQDWSYYDSRAALLLAQGDAEAAQESLDHANTLVADRVEAGGNCKALHLNMLRNREEVLYQQSHAYPENEQLRNQLGITQSQIWAIQTSDLTGPCP